MLHGAVFTLLQRAAWLLVAVLFLAHGWQGRLYRDDANLMYAGQQAARGIPPYQSIFNMTGPVPPLIAGAGAVVARAFQSDDLITTRFAFFAISVLAAGLVCRLGQRVGLGTLAAMAGAWIMAAYPTFARSALNGPQKKTVMVFFVAAALLAYEHRNWFIAGAAGLLAGLCWQGAFAVLPALITGAIAAGFRPLLHMVAGAGTAGLAVAASYLCTGSFGEMLDGTFGMLAFHPLNTADAPARLTRALLLLPTWQLAIYMLATIALIGSATSTIQHVRPFAQAARDTRVVAALGLSLTVALSLRDFQGTPDFFILLPFLGLGGALATNFAARVAPRWTTLLVAVMGCATVFTAASAREHELLQQRQRASAIVEHFGEDASVRVVGAPEWLVLTHRTQSDSFVFIGGGIDQYIDERRAGGFEGWLERLKKEAPDGVLLGPTSGVRVGSLFEWLETNYQAHPMGPWTVYARKPD